MPGSFASTWVVDTSRRNAETFDRFYRTSFNPYLNFHRACGVPEIRTNNKGKQKRFYPWYAPPWEILRHLPGLAAHLRPGLTLSHPAAQARQHSDTEAPD